jgi:RND family efflux transporter MFP subunit
LASLFCVAGADCAFADDTASPQQSSVEVQTAPLRQETLTDVISGYGTVATSEDAMVDVAFLHAGQISQLHIRPGESVRAGQKLIELTADPSATLSFERAQAALDFAKRDLARTQSLVAQHLATNAQLAAAQKAVDDAEAALATERQLGNDRRIDIATAAYDGYIANLAVALGDRIQPNTTVLKLARTDQGVRVTVGFEPEDARRIQPSMPTEISPVFAADQHLEGSVRSIGGTLNPASRRIDTWIDAPASPGPSMAPGTAVAVRITVAQHIGWVVPRQAVLRDDRGDYIFQIADDGKARRVTVQTGLQTDQEIEIAGQLDPALKVVTLGNYELQDGAAVREQGPPAAAAAAAAPGSQPASQPGAQP